MYLCVVEANDSNGVLPHSPTCKDCQQANHRFSLCWVTDAAAAAARVHFGTPAGARRQFSTC